MLNGLGIAYSCRVRHEVDSEDINQAIQCLLRVAAITPNEHAEKPSRLYNLGSRLRMRWKQLKVPEDVDSAIEAYIQALNLLPQTHVLAHVIQNVLSEAYIDRCSYSNDPQDLARALEHAKTAAASSEGSPRSRFEASRHWARLLSAVNLSTPLPAHRASMQLLPQVVWIGTTATRRYESVVEVGAVTIEAAVAAISANNYGLALEWLEEGRSIVWNQLLQLRTPIDALTEVDPALAKSLEQVSNDLQRASMRVSNPSFIGTNTMDSEQAILQHHRLVAQYDKLIGRIRDLPGFCNFMCAKKVKDQASVAGSGPVVIVTVHTKRCDVLVLRAQTDEVEHIPLPNLFHKDVVELQRQMYQSLESKSFRQRKPHIRPRGSCDHFGHILTALWDNLVKPVLDYLGYTDKLPVDQLPHITWCTTGAFSFLPIHAAGNYDSGEERIYDYAITSYTPTLSALLPAASHPISDVSGVLAVSQESTPGLSALPGTKNELAAIQKHVDSQPYMQLEKSQATPAAVLNAMEKYSSVHLACHASQNVDDPTKSCFHLHGGILSLEEIAQRSLKNKGLAFLSACQTATGDQKMPDEAIHLAAGMLVACDCDDVVNH